MTQDFMAGFEKKGETWRCKNPLDKHERGATQTAIERPYTDYVNIPNKGLVSTGWTVAIRCEECGFESSADVTPIKPPK